MKTALVIGGGPAGLMAAEVLSAGGVSVTVADQMPSFGRKLLMAGKSGLNLTKDEPFEQFVARYPNAAPQLLAALKDFGPKDVKEWAEGLGEALFTGSTGRVFPEVMKASPLLRAWLTRLGEAGVTFRTRYRWIGWDGATAVFDTPDGSETITADVTILALGGKSWARLGSDGKWADQFKDVAPFQPSNCGFRIEWSRYMQSHFGKAIKSVCLKAGALSSRGEFVLSAKGIEGGGIYEVSSAVRDGASLAIDLLPDVPIETLRGKWSNRRSKSTVTQFLKSLRFPAEKIALFNEVTKPMKTPDICDLLKSLPIAHVGPFPIDEAISTNGGVKLDAVDRRLMLRDRSGTFVAGEMMNWDAPTGGYLLTACLATGRMAGSGALKYLNFES